MPTKEEGSFIGVKILTKLWSHPIKPHMEPSCEHYPDAISKQEKYCSQCGKDVKLFCCRKHTILDQGTPNAPFVYDAKTDQLMYREYTVGFFDSKVYSYLNLNSDAFIAVKWMSYESSDYYYLAASLEDLQKLQTLITQLTADKIQFEAGIWTSDVPNC